MRCDGNWCSGVELTEVGEIAKHDGQAAANRSALRVYGLVAWKEGQTRRLKRGCSLLIEKAAGSVPLVERPTSMRSHHVRRFAPIARTRVRRK